MRTKKYRIGDEALARILVDKQMEKYEVDSYFLQQNEQIDGISWFTYFTATQEEHDAWISFCKEFIKNNVTPKMSDKEIDKQLSMFDLMYGLKIV